MQYLGLLIAGAAAVSAQGVTSAISPQGTAPAGCEASYDGTFEITVVKPAAKRDLERRAACGGEGTLVITLENGILKDNDGRTGYIASNYQFQFDGPPQAGAIYTAGFSVCGNSSLALGPSTTFYQCLSGGFYNLYNKNWAAQCSPVAIDAIPCGSGSAPSPVVTSAAAGQSPDGQPTAASAVSQITDGQPQAGSAIPVSQYTDGQPQVPTALVSQITDGQPQAPTAAPNATVASPSITPAVGAAAAYGLPASAVAAVAGLAAFALL